MAKRPVVIDDQHTLQRDEVDVRRLQRDLEQRGRVLRATIPSGQRQPIDAAEAAAYRAPEVHLRELDKRLRAAHDDDEPTVIADSRDSRRALSGVRTTESDIDEPTSVGSTEQILQGQRLLEQRGHVVVAKIRDDGLETLLGRPTPYSVATPTPVVQIPMLSTRGPQPVMSTLPSTEPPPADEDDDEDRPPSVLPQWMIFVYGMAVGVLLGGILVMVATYYFEGYHLALVK